MKITKLSINQILAFLVVIVLAFSNTSCDYTDEIGALTEREDFTLDLQDFSTVTLDFPAEVLIYKGDQQSIKINAQPEIFEAITKTVVNEEWLIDLANFRGGFESVTIEITMPTIKGLHTTSTGDIRVQDKFDAVDLLNLSVESTGDIDYKGNADQINLLINGTGDVQLSGATGFLNARLSSTGDLSAYNLKSAIVEIISTSTGDAEIRVEKELMVTMTSTGDVKYKGNPQITSSISGIGDLRDEN